MTRITLGAERLIDAPADVVYHLIANYRDHHRVGGFLPDAFTDLRVDHGGIGAGTVITFSMRAAGRTQTLTAHVTEPEPGRVLHESGGPVETTFTVDPVGERQARVRISTVLTSGGLEGVLSRLLAPRLLEPIYHDELARLERRAQEVARTPA